MICDKCRKQGLKSEVYSLGAKTTKKSAKKYFDEEGIYHKTGSNKTITSFECSNGHTWTKMISTSDLQEH